MVGGSRRKVDKDLEGKKGQNEGNQSGTFYKTIRRPGMSTRSVSPN